MIFRLGSNWNSFFNLKNEVLKECPIHAGFRGMGTK